MPATATPRKPQTLARKLVETRNTSRNRGLAAMLGLGESEKELARDFGSGLNDVIGRGTLASLIGLPGDLGGLAENGIRSALGMPQVQPYGGSEHIGQKLEEAGLVSPVRRPKTELLASLISPSQAASAAYRAPQMARAGVRMLDNLAAPRTMGSQTGAIRNIFHGTTPEAAAAIEREGFDLSKSADGSIWFTSNPNIGEVAASGKGGIVKRALDDEVLRLGGWDEADKYGVDELLQQGYDGLKLDDGEEAVYQIFNPEKLMPQQPVGNLGKMVAPQDDALRVAQQGGLPSLLSGGDNVRMGGPIEVWHGTDVEFDTPQTPLFLGDRAMAESYAADRASVSGFEPVLMGGTANFRKTATDADVKQVAKSLGIEVENDMAFSVLDPNISGKAISKRVMDALKAKGFDSAHIDDFSPQDPFTLTKSYVAFDPSALNIKRVKDK